MNFFPPVSPQESWSGLCLLFFIILFCFSPTVGQTKFEKSRRKGIFLFPFSSISPQESRYGQPQRPDVFHSLFLFFSESWAFPATYSIETVELGADDGSRAIVMRRWPLINSHSNAPDARSKKQPIILSHTTPPQHAIKREPRLTFEPELGLSARSAANFTPRRCYKSGQLTLLSHH